MQGDDHDDHVHARVRVHGHDGPDVLDVPDEDVDYVGVHVSDDDVSAYETTILKLKCLSIIILDIY